jgi:hypothetical protein
MKIRRSIPSALALTVGIGSWIVASQAAMADEPVQQPQQTTQLQQPLPTQQPAARTKTTGSNILRVRSDHNLPLLVLDRDYIDQSSATNAKELIRSVPQAQNFGGFVPVRP